MRPTCSNRSNLKKATWPVDRTSRSLGEVLGTRVERAILDATDPPLWTFLPPLRRLAAPSGARFAERGLLDGYLLAKHARTGIPWGRDGLPAADSTEAVTITRILTDLEEVLDARTDLGCG